MRIAPALYLAAAVIWAALAVTFWHLGPAKWIAIVDAGLALAALTMGVVTMVRR